MLIKSLKELEYREEFYIPLPSRSHFFVVENEDRLYTLQLSVLNNTSKIVKRFRCLGSMSRRLLLLILFLFPAYSVFAESRQELSFGSQELLQRAQQNSLQRFQYAKAEGAQIEPTPDGRSFTIFWDPDPKAFSKEIVVTLHGHAGYATHEFYMWHPFLKKRKIAILALQWWLGDGERIDDYYSPIEMYPILQKILKENGFSKVHALLHGFSRGSANVYALEALDQNAGSHFFRLVLANAGGAVRNYPPNRAIEEGQFGEKPYQGTHWAMFCGALDPNPDKSGCLGMTSTKDWVTALGGTVDLFIQDPDKGHGGFHQTPGHVEKVLDLFENLDSNQLPVTSYQKKRD